MDSKELTKIIYSALDDKKGENIKILDISKVSIRYRLLQTMSRKSCISLDWSLRTWRDTAAPHGFYLTIRTL